MGNFVSDYKHNICGIEVWNYVIYGLKKSIIISQPFYEYGYTWVVVWTPEKSGVLDSIAANDFRDKSQIDYKLVNLLSGPGRSNCLNIKYLYPTGVQI